MNRTKAIVVAQFAAYWVIVAGILLAARDVYDAQFAQSVSFAGNRGLAELGVLLALTALVSVLSAGVIRGWRWIFWVILVAFFAGILHVPASALQLARIVPSQSPAWYVVLQAVVGLAQFVVALAMLAGYRKAGVWGAF